MLRQYAFSFYEVVTRIEQLRPEARSLSGRSAYIGPTKVYAHSLDELTATLIEMRAECDKLDLTSTTDLISHIESEVHLKGKDYNYADMLNHLDTLSVLFAKELRKRFFFGIEDEKKKYFQKDELFGTKVSIAFPSCINEIRNAGNCCA